MISLFAPPVFAAADRAQRARIFHFMAWTTMLLGGGFLAFAMALGAAAASRSGSAILFIVSLCLILLEISRRGRTRLASALYVGGLALFATAMSLTGGGIRAPSVTAYVIMPLAAGLLLGDRVAIGTTLVCAALALGLALVEAAGMLPPTVDQYSAIALWVLTCVYMVAVLVVVRLATEALSGALHRAESELSERRHMERQRERAEKELQENQLLLQTMIENTPAAVAMFDTEMRYIAYSRRWLTDYRLGDRDIKGLSHYAVFPEIGEDWKMVHRRCLAGAKEGREEDPFPRSDGTVDIVRWSVQPWHKSGDEIGGITMFTEVITERLRAREERRLLRTQLQQSQKIEALGTLAGGIAHDFNNVLAVIGTNANLGRSEVPEGHPAQGSFDEIVRATALAKGIVRQILLFGRKQEAERRTISLQPVVEDALRFLRATLPANIQFRTLFEPGLPHVSADASQIHQVIVNLGTNAAHAMSMGGMLSVSTERVAIDQAAAVLSADVTPGDYVRVTVQDTGIGMSRETLQRAFEPFFTTKGAEGTGLGLSVVHGIVRDHEGAVTVESEPGMGATFSVYFPALPAGAEPHPETVELVRGRGEHLLYIDDEQSLASAIKRAIECLGYRCTACSDPVAAVQAVRANPHEFDAVITDMTMSSMSGLDVVQALLAIRSSLPVAVTSGRWSESADSPAWVGVRTRIPKPATISELSQALRALLQKTN